jgi:acyl carrier protein
MKKAEIRKQAKELLIKELNERHSRKKSGTVFKLRDIKASTRFKEDLGLDSLDMVEMLMVFEENLFGGSLYLDESMFTKMPTFGEVEKVLLEFYEEHKDNPKLFREGIEK